MYRRTLDVRKLAERKSLFLFGPRSTGKTTLLRAQFCCSPGAVLDGMPWRRPSSTSSTWASPTSRRRLRSELTYWRTQSGIEVDFLVGSTAAIDRDLKGLRALAEEGSGTASFLVSFDELDRRTDEGIRLLHWRTFLAELWADALF